MNREDIRFAITGIFGKVFKEPNLVLKDEYSATDFEKWDSINNIIIISRIEKHFKIQIETGEIIELRNIGGLLNLIELKLV